MIAAMTEHDDSRGAKLHLRKMIDRVMRDGHLDPGERDELLDFFRSGYLQPTDVREVFREVLDKLRDEVLADGVVTEEEREKCRTWIRELRIPASFIGPELRAIIDGGA